MSISNIQKKRFLETIYKIYYSLGSAPSEDEVGSLYGRYFSRNAPSQSISVPYDTLNSQSIIDHDTLNRIMVHILFNLDIIYENYYDQVENLYEIITSYNKRIDSIKSRRAEIEKKVDDHLFALKNSDGFYYSSTNAFNNIDLVDLNISTAYIDIESRKATIPKLTSGLFNYVGNLINSSSTANMSVIFDGSQVSTSSQNISNIFNGLSNSQWQYVHKSRTIGLCTIKLSISFQGADNAISLVEGKVSSQKPLDIAVTLVNSNDSTKSQTSIKSQQNDYDKFSFNFSPDFSNTIELYLTKSEADYVTNENGETLYNYDFRIDELVVTAPYYDSGATLISKPISLPVQDNTKLVIDAVSLSVNDETPQGTEIAYYVAQDNPSALTAYDFDWKIISPTNIRNANYPSVINFNGTDRLVATISSSEADNPVSTKNTMYSIPRSEELNNPIVNYFYNSDSAVLGFNVYRLAKFASEVDPYESYILENVDANQLSISISYGSTLDKQTWQDVITGQRTDILYTSTTATINNTQTFFEASNINYGSIRLSTGIYSDQNIEITDDFLKSLSAQYWDVRVYLNGSEITSTGGALSPGTLSSSLTWRFKKGVNDLVIIINKSTNNTSNTETPFNGTISLFKTRNLLSIPGLIAYRNYLYEVKIEDLRSKYSNTDNVYSIINYENSKEIVYRRTNTIGVGSKVYYFSNKSNAVEAIRLRADLFRGSNVYSAPAINSYSLKFKH
jgi:hypothetical protein